MMKTKILIGAHAYACIETEKRTMDVLLSAGRGAQQSLRETVANMRAKAEKITQDANFIESAIPSFDNVRIIK